MNIKFEDLVILSKIGHGSSSNVFKCIVKNQPH